jgi:ankyrin repeat protein
MTSQQEESFDQLLLMATKAGELELVQSLLENGISANTKFEPDEVTALMHAASKNFTEIAELLLQHGAHVDIQDGNWDTALMWAAAKGNVPLTQLLLDHGADIHLKDKESDTALIWAAGRGHPQTIELLLQYGADINIKGHNHDTPLMRAANMGHIEAIKFLLEHKADIHAKNLDGKTALAIAREKKHTEVADLLQEFQTLQEAWENRPFIDPDAKTKQKITGTCFSILDPLTPAQIAFCETILP